jgi:hypothetical protein
VTTLVRSSSRSEPVPPNRTTERAATGSGVRCTARRTTVGNPTPSGRKRERDSRPRCRRQSFSGSPALVAQMRADDQGKTLRRESFTDTRRLGFPESRSPRAVGGHARGGIRDAAAVNLVAPLAYERCRSLTPGRRTLFSRRRCHPRAHSPAQLPTPPHTRDTSSRARHARTRRPTSHQ